MHKRLMAAGLAAILMTNAASAQTLNVATAGDQNMVDYIKDYLGPMFEKSHPGVKVVAVGTGPGRRRIAEDLREARRAEEGGRQFRFRRGGHSPEGRRHHGAGRADQEVPRCSSDRLAGDARHRRQTPSART